MNWHTIFLETIVMVFAFNFIIFVPLSRNPVWWIQDYPEDIQEEYFKDHPRLPVEPLSKTVLLKKGCATIAALILFIVLMKVANANTFIDGFLGSYFIWTMISIWDCVFMDWVLFANMKSIRLPGTEHMDKAYHQKKYHFVRGLKGMIIGLIPCLITGLVFNLIK